MELMMQIFVLSLFYFIFRFCYLIWKERGQGCYMLAYECYKPPESQKLSPDSCVAISWRNKNLDLEEYRFLLKVIVNSGIGEETYAPKIVIEGREECPPLDEALLELDDIFYDTLDKLFARSSVSPSDIDIIVTTVSLVSPVPSLSSRIINHYKMRMDIKSFDITGMSCSSSIVGINLVQNLLKVHKDKLAIVVSTECLGLHWYCGKEKSMMLTNCLFRVGGCSMLFTNKRALHYKAMLKLKCMVRTHLGSNDEAYKACLQVADEFGYQGFRLTKLLPKAGAMALGKNLRVLMPKIMPLWELIRYASAIVKNRSMKEAASSLNVKNCVEHFCIHPGGRAVVDGIGKSLRLNDYDLEPSRMALHRFGNTSTAGLWYVLSYLEAKKRLKKGDRIMMIGLGAGFKCNNCVWEVLRDLEDANVWKECINNYPPKTDCVNPLIEKWGWIYDEHLNFVRLR